LIEETKHDEIESIEQNMPEFGMKKVLSLIKEESMQSPVETKDSSIPIEEKD
jgi:hypothetical protein